VLSLAAPGCGSSHHVSVTATPSPSLEDEPVDVAVRGLPAHAVATIRLTSIDAAGARWAASARFRTDAHGHVDLARQAPISGYPGVWPLGLTELLSPSRALTVRVYRWSTTRPAAFHVSVSSQGRMVARTTYRRQLAFTRIVRETASVDHDGFVGDYVAPAGKPRAAVLLFGGSEGGLAPYVQTLAAHLAGHGVAALAIGYFGLPGTPDGLSRIPLEYFVRATRWLQAKSSLRGRITVMGTSRGSEAALLLGAHFPDLVGRVVGVVPSSVVNAAYPISVTSAWTLHGRPLPYEQSFGYAGDSHDPATIPVERIRGPLMTICAGADDIWPSCSFARAIAGRRRAHGAAAHDVYATAAGATHVETAELVPGIPGFVSADFDGFGVVASERDRERIWPQLLRFLGATP
jgi:dienelactone hydrolase